ncbi:rCG30727, isoform CRA_a [Rattus norvegicus]|uniref:RCG30727, isoform CRA_a n=1 Tax=Rattus norvegicus TaxID=10116 RepID=A6IUF5_RAT|nr:rCG30727, isoform CRA_a [Rattus norvegicus]EDL81206.1 rCG30727, isoform CRA_a [Rattus norvegicus]
MSAEMFKFTQREAPLEH